MRPMRRDRGGHNHVGGVPAAAAHGPGLLSPEVMNLANLITLGRLCLVPVAVGLVLRGQYGWAFGCFVVAGLSDALDGWLARRRGGTALGAFLDPLADKLLLAGMVVTLAAVGALPGWLAAVVVGRDAVIVGGIGLMWLMGWTVRFRPTWLGKANTALQIMLVGVVLLLEALDLPAPEVRSVLEVAVAVATAVSGVLYVRAASRGAYRA